MFKKIFTLILCFTLLVSNIVFASDSSFSQSDITIDNKYYSIQITQISETEFLSRVIDVSTNQYLDSNYILQLVDTRWQ